MVQATHFSTTHASVTLCPVTSDCIDVPLFRIALPAGKRTGLTAVSQVMVDKVVSVPHQSIGKRVGHCETAQLRAIDEALRDWPDV